MSNSKQFANKNHAQFELLCQKLRHSGSAFTVEVDGVPMSYWQAGTGSRVLVFLHGNSAAKEVFFRQFSHFAGADLSLIAIDLPGHGCSGNALHPDSQYTISGYALIVHHLLEHLNVRDYVLVGWSLGGNIAIEMAGRGFPLKAMLLMGAPPVGPGTEDFEKAYLPATFDSAVSKGDTTDDEITAYTKMIYGSLEPIPELFTETARRTDGHAREIMVSHWLSGVDGCNQQATVASWKNPVCVIHGECEPFVSLPYLENVAWRNLWGNKIHTLGNCGHAPFLEDSAVFNTLLESFISDIF